MNRSIHLSAAQTDLERHPCQATPYSLGRAGSPRSARLATIATPSAAPSTESEQGPLGGVIADTIGNVSDRDGVVAAGRDACSGVRS
jgi:hypothetical protein